jgi:hypothetical protein
MPHIRFGVHGSEGFGKGLPADILQDADIVNCCLPDQYWIHRVVKKSPVRI